MISQRMSAMPWKPRAHKSKSKKTKKMLDAGNLPSSNVRSSGRRGQEAESKRTLLGKPFREPGPLSLNHSPNSFSDPVACGRERVSTRLGGCQGLGGGLP